MPPRGDQATDLIRAFTEELNGENYDAVKTYFADDYVELHDNDGEPVSELVQAERERAEAFADKHEAIDVILTDRDGDRGKQFDVWYTVTGTHDGEFLNLPPTGTDVEFPLLRVITVEDGRVTRYRVVYTLGFLLDLGLDWQTLTDEVDMQQYLTSPAAAGSARAD